MIASLLGVGLATMSPAVGGDAPVRFAQLNIHSRVIIRVQSAVPMTPVEIVEKKAPRCIPLAAVAGAAVAGTAGVDFILRGGQRVRARFSSRCPALDYYSGFYIAPNPDGLVCVDRDVIRSRAGGECAIDRMRTLVIRQKKP